MRGFLGLTAACALMYGLLVLFCSEAGAALLLHGLTWRAAPVAVERLRGAQAIVVISGTIERVDEAARLHRATGLPILLSGKGGGDAYFPAESMTLQKELRTRHGLEARWMEVEAVDTLQNARFSWCMLAPAGIRRIALVTDPFHMPRARALFEAAGFDVVAAPYMDAPPLLPPLVWSVNNFIPTGAGLRAAKRPLLESVGAVLEPLELAARGGNCPRTDAVH